MTTSTTRPPQGMKTDSVQLLYGGQVRFEYHDGKHRYLAAKRIKDGLYAEPAPVTGITTVINIIGKDALVQGAVNKTLELLAGQSELTPALLAGAKTAYRREWAKGAGFGALGHKLIEALLRGREIKFPDKPELTEQLENVAIQHEQFEAAFSPQNIHVEQPMYSLLHNFAGTDDRFCVIGAQNVLIDYKTSNRSYYSPDGIYPSNFAQLGGQILLIEEQLGETVDDAWIVNFAKDSVEFKLKRLSDLGLTTLDAKLYFLACLNLYELNKTFEWRCQK